MISQCGNVSKCSYVYMSVVTRKITWILAATGTVKRSSVVVSASIVVVIHDLADNALRIGSQDCTRACCIAAKVCMLEV